MIVVNTRPEDRLVETLQSTKAQSDTARCILIPAADLPAADAERLPQTILRWAEDAEGHLFPCANGDVFAIVAKISFRHFSDLAQDIAARKPEARADQAAFLFDLRKDWPRLMAATEKAVAHRAALDRAEAMRESAEAEERRRAQILGRTLDEKKVKTLQQVRAERPDMRILLVEDDLFTGKLVSGALKSEGAVLHVETGDAALSRYVREAPDIVFLDIELPDISGHDILKKLIGIDPQAFIVMLSGNGNRDNIMRAVQMGAKGFVGKPFTKDKLLQYVQKCPKHSMPPQGRLE